MLRSQRVQKNQIVKNVRTQIAGLKARPELAKGLVSSSADLEGLLAKSLERQADYENLSRSSLAALGEAHTALYQLRERFMANLSVAAARYGAGSAEARLLGAKPRRSRRSKSTGDTGMIGTIA